MRAALAIATAILMLALASRPMYGQMPAGDALALETIHMVDAQIGWAVAHGFRNELLRTADGGTSWRDVTPAGSSGQRAHVWRITVLSSLIAWVMPSNPVGSTSTEVFRTFDGGRTWRSASISAPLVESISIINPLEGWLIAFLAAATGRQSVEIYRSTDGGQSRIKVAASEESSGLPLYGGKNSITFRSPTTGWIPVYDLHPNSQHLYVTRDGGCTWRQQSLPLLRSHSDSRANHYTRR